MAKGVGGYRVRACYSRSNPGWFYAAVVSPRGRVIFAGNDFRSHFDALTWANDARNTALRCGLI